MAFYSALHHMYATLLLIKQHITMLWFGDIFIVILLMENDDPTCRYAFPYDIIVMHGHWLSCMFTTVITLDAFHIIYGYDRWACLRRNKVELIGHVLFGPGVGI